MEATSSNQTKPTTCHPTHLISKIKVDKEKFNQLDCKPVGDEKLMKTFFTLEDGSKNHREQNYFSGLVYRFDSRSISTIKEAGGFYPRVPRDKDHRVLAYEVIEQTFLYGYNPVVSKECTGIIATSKSISRTNGWLSEDCTRYKYMIDTKMKGIQGLDPDYFRINEYPSFEVCFEDPIPFSCIIGFFEGKNYEAFYLNKEYKGAFSWNTENIVQHYQSATTEKTLTDSEKYLSQLINYTAIEAAQKGLAVKIDQLHHYKNKEKKNRCCPVQ